MTGGYTRGFKDSSHHGEESWKPRRHVHENFQVARLLWTFDNSWTIVQTNLFSFPPKHASVPLQKWQVKIQKAPLKTQKKTWTRRTLTSCIHTYAHETWKTVVERWISFWDGLLSMKKAILALGRELRLIGILHVSGNPLKVEPFLQGAEVRCQDCFPTTKAYARWAAGDITHHDAGVDNGDLGQLFPHLVLPFC